MYAIVSPDYTTEFVGILRRNNGLSYHFMSMTIPHKGKRYKTYGNALYAAERINKANGYPVCKVIETLI